MGKGAEMGHKLEGGSFSDLLRTDTLNPMGRGLFKACTGWGGNCLGRVSCSLISTPNWDEDLGREGSSRCACELVHGSSSTVSDALNHPLTWFNSYSNYTR